MMGLAGLIIAMSLIAHWIPAPEMLGAGAPAGTPDAQAAIQQDPTPTLDFSPASPVADIPTPAPTRTAEPDTRTLAEQQADAIRLLLTETDGLSGVVLISSVGEVVAEHNADLPFVSASLYKVVLIADILGGIESGAIAPETTVTLLEEWFASDDQVQDGYFPADWVGEAVDIETLIVAAGAHSSNVAALALRTFTSAEDLARLAEGIGMTASRFFMTPATDPAWPPVQPAGVSDEDFARTLAVIDIVAAEGTVSVTTPRDMARLFEALLDGEVISPSVSEAVLDVLREQAIVDRIPALLPADTVVAHKTGNLEGVVHDAGIIWTPDGPVILVAMIEDETDDDAANAVIRRLGAIAWGETEPLVATPESVTVE
jgi:beta-lactamase class A